MTNIFSDGTLWSDGTHSPPSNWNGTEFEFVGTGNTLIAFTGTSADYTLPIPFNWQIVTPRSDDVACQMTAYWSDGSEGVYPFGTAVASGTGSIALPDGADPSATFAGVSCGDGFYGADVIISGDAVPPVQPTNYNCDCDDDFPTQTLAQLQRRMLVRLGYAAMPTPPPGMAELINDFLYDAQVQLYRRYRCFRLERWFTWQIVPGQRFYDLNGNLDTCTKKLDARRITWVGISKGDNCWQPLFEGIEPTMYSPKTEALPVRYEIRQCIEIWPGTADTDWLLRIKGDFGLLPFVGPDDVTTIDADVVFLYALANAKAHYGQPDAANMASESAALIGGYVAGTHGTQRRWPGTQPIANAIPPKMV